MQPFGYQVTFVMVLYMAFVGSLLAQGPCHEAEMTLIAHKEQSIGKWGVAPLGLEMPRCEDDGSFSPVQCRGSQCFCVSPTGGYLGNYQVNRWEADGMHCSCARDQFKHQQSGEEGKLYFCADNGNYDDVQCEEDGNCYCTDSYGGRTDEMTFSIVLKMQGIYLCPEIMAAPMLPPLPSP